VKDIFYYQKMNIDLDALIFTLHKKRKDGFQPLAEIHPFYFLTVAN
jgi:hypothetical protein